MKDEMHRVQVGPVVGSGASAHKLVTVGNWRLAILSTQGDEPRVRDLDLAERLGYARPREIRHLIRGLIEAGKLLDVAMRGAVQRIEKRGAIRGVEEREVEEFWLTEAQALKVIAKSGTDAADALLDEMIEVFRLAIRGMLPVSQGNAAQARLDAFLLNERQKLERLLTHEFITEICRLYGWGHLPGNVPPQLLRGVMGRLYVAILGQEVRDEMKARAGTKDLYEFLTPEAQRMVQTNLSITRALAEQSRTADEFWMRIEAHFQGKPLQFGFGFS